MPTPAYDPHADLPPSYVATVKSASEYPIVVSNADAEQSRQTTNLFSYLEDGEEDPRAVTNAVEGVSDEAATTTTGENGVNR